jgi:hypothetical protein
MKQRKKNGKLVFALTEGTDFITVVVCPQTLIMTNLDLFVGNRVCLVLRIPCDQTLLINDGKGNFKRPTVDLARSLKDWISHRCTMV